LNSACGPPVELPIAMTCGGVVEGWRSAMGPLPWSGRSAGCAER